MRRILLAILSLVLSLSLVPGCASTEYPIHKPGVTAKAKKPKIKWRPFSESALIAANGANRPAFLYFGSKTCGPCKTLEKDVFSDPAVIETLNSNFVPIKITDDNDATTFYVLMNKFELEGVPSVVILSSTKPHQVIGQATGVFDQPGMILFLNATKSLNTLLILESQVNNMTENLLKGKVNGPRPGDR